MELAFTGGFAWAAWQVLGRLQRHAAKIEKNLDDGILLGQWEDECKAMAEKKERVIPAMGQGAAATAHDHIFEDWRSDKLKLPQKIQLASDLADLAQWAGAGNWVPELRAGPVKPWSEMGMGAKVHLLQAADALQFNFAEVAKQQAEGLAENWLWQVTEALPALSAEPVKATAPATCLADLKTRLAEADSAVRAAFEAERRSAVAGLKSLVQPLSVASCVRKMQVLKLLLQDVGLTSTTAMSAVKTIRTELAAPLTLEAADSAVREQKEAAGAAVAAAAEAAVSTERATREAEIEMAAARTYRRALTLLASSPTHWHTGSDTAALHKVGLLAALLEEMVACDSAGTADGAAAAAELADAVRKLTPQIRIKLSEDQAARQADVLAALTPAPPPPSTTGEPPAAAAADEGQKEAPKPEEGAAAEDKAAGEEAAPGAEAPAVAEAPRPAPPAAASELRSLLEGVIRGQLAEARAERKAARAAARKAAAWKAAAARKAAAAAAAAASAVSDAAPEAGEPTAAPEAESEAGKDEIEAAAAPAAEEAVVESKEEATEGEPESKEGEEGSKEVPAESGQTAVEASGPEAAAAAPQGEEVAAAVEDAPAAAAESTTVPQIPATEESSAADASVEGAAGVAEPAVPEQIAEEARSSSEEQTPAVEAEEEEVVEAEEEEEPPTAAELVDVEVVRAGVEAEAKARADAEKEAALLRLQDALEALRKRTAAEATAELVRQVTAVAATPRSSESGVSEGDIPPAGPDTGSRLFALESLLRGAAAAPDAGLATAVEDAAAKLTASDRSALDTASKAALARVEVAVVRVRLTADVGKMEMGPGCCEVLRRTDAWLAGMAEAEGARQERAAAWAARVQARKEAAAAAAAEAATAAAAAAESTGTVEEAPAAGAEGEGVVEEGAGGEAVAAEVQEATSAGEGQEAAAPEAAAAAGDAEVKGKEGLVEAEEEEPEVEGPSVDTARLSEGRTLVSQLLAEGLVLLELPGPSNRKLQLLRESVDALDPLDGDGAVQSRLMVTLKEVVGQLGPIGGCVEARVNQVAADAERQLLLQVRSAATSIYLALTALLKLEGETWEAAKTNLDQAKTAVYGMKVERRADGLATALSGCGLTAERCAALAGAVLGLGTEAAKKPAGVAEGALRAAAEQAHVLSASLHEYISYVRLREHALGAPLTAKADIEEDYELVLPTLSDMTDNHGQEGAVEWLDLAGMGLPAPEEEGEEGADGDEGPQSAHDRALSELQQRLDGWHSAGLKMLARGQVALVTLGGGALEGGELRLTADLGLPSAKSLLQLGAERLARLQLMAAEDSAGRNSGVQHPVNWYLLVPPAAVAPLTAFVQDNAYFGLQRGQVHVFSNDVRPPLLNADMQVVLESSGTRVARSAPGSGEVFLALRRSGALSHMRRSGVRWLEVEAVEDNLTARPLDPSFLGACAGAGVHAGTKVAVPGVTTEGPSALPELYSRYLELLGSSSNLLPALGDAVPAIGTYLFSMAYLNRVDRLLREQPLALYRLAPADKIPGKGAAAAAAAAGKGSSGGGAATAAGGGVAGYKLERRLSDFASPAILSLLPDVRLAMVAVDAGAEFCPVWGATPFYRTASPKTAVNALLLQHTRWVEESGGAVAEEEGVVEVSPLVSYAGEGLGPLVEGKTFEEAYVHELQGFAADSTGAATNLGVWALPAVVMYAGAAAVRLLGKAAGGGKAV